MAHSAIDVWTAALVVAVALAITTRAQADDGLPTFQTEPSSVVLTPQPRGGGLFAMHAFLEELRAIPTLTLGVDPNARLRGPSQSIVGGGPVTFAGAGFDTALTVADRWIMPVLGADFSAAVLRSDRVVTSVDGSIAEVRPWTSKKLDVWIWGIGVRAKHRRWLWEATIQPGVAVLWTDAAVATGVNEVTVPAHAFSFATRVTFSMCRRFDPTNRGCLFASPSLYEFGPFNAISVGLSWEFGP